MVIWYVSKYANPFTRHFYLAKEWIKQGHQAFVITAGSSYKGGELMAVKGKAKFVFESDLKSVYLNTYLSKSAGGWERIKSWLHFEWQFLTFSKKRLETPDVIIVSSLSLLTVITGYFFSKKYNSKFVFEVRDIWPKSAIVLGGFKPSNPFIRILAWIEKFGYKRAVAIVGTMPNLSLHIKSILGESHKTYCIPQGVDLDFYKNTRPLTEEYLCQYVPDNKFIIIYTGTLNANNPLENFIAAAGRLKDEYNIHFLIVGNGYERDNLIKLASGLKNVTFPPVVDKLQVNDLLKRADVCFDSFDSELAKFGLSRNKWIDYMFAGKPIICEYSGFQSMINDAHAGTFVPFGNIDLLTATILEYSKMDKILLNEMGERAKRFLIENRTFGKLASEYINILNRDN